MAEYELALGPFQALWYEKHASYGNAQGRMRGFSLERTTSWNLRLIVLGLLLNFVCAD